MIFKKISLEKNFSVRLILRLFVCVLLYAFIRPIMVGDISG
jgi:hypothetical protein